MYASLVHFKRDRDSNWEHGIALCKSRGDQCVEYIFPLEDKTNAGRPTPLEMIPWSFTVLWTDGNIAIPNHIKY